MSAAPVGVDRPREAEAFSGDVVQGGAGADLVEVDAHRLGGVEGADDGAVADAGEAHVVLDPLLVPPHTNTCSHKGSTRPRGLPAPGARRLIPRRVRGGAA